MSSSLSGGFYKKEGKETRQGHRPQTFTTRGFANKLERICYAVLKYHEPYGTPHSTGGVPEDEPHGLRRGGLSKA